MEKKQEKKPKTKSNTENMQKQVKSSSKEEKKQPRTNQKQSTSSKKAPTASVKHKKTIKEDPNSKSKGKTISNKQSKISKLIPKTTSEIILVLTFILLLITVITLGIKATKLKEEYERKNDADLVIPILKSGETDSFLVDLSEMKKDEIKEYKFMVTNYKNQNIAQEEIKYNIELVNNSEAVTIKLYKEKEGKNLLNAEGPSHNIENHQLLKGKKASTTYYLIIRAKDEVQQKDNISIKITSIN